MTLPALPSLSSLLKSREVEDPVNLYVHRPLAYSFVKLFYHTSLTPNGITLLATIVGVSAGACWIVGTPGMMVLGGILLWSSAILDGADGIMARAKGIQSQFGRALDGTSDMVVAAATVIAAVHNLWVRHHNPTFIALSVPIIVLTVLHLNLYDFYKESFLRMTRPERGGEGEDVAELEERVRSLNPQRTAWLERFAMGQVFLPFMQLQQRLIARTNPAANREGMHFVRNEATANIYRQHNTGPMRLWSLISLAPHSYLMAIFGMLDRIDAYMWIRLVVMNAVFIIVLAWQRRSTERTMRELAVLGYAPQPLGHNAANGELAASSSQAR